MYFASLRFEEGQHILFHVAYIDPANPDPSPPRRIRQNRWSYTALGSPIDFTVANVVKLAKASDPRASSLAVYHTGTDSLAVWGLVDQGHHYHGFVNHDSESGPERPGLFQVSIRGIGHLVAYIRYELIAELHVDKLRGKAIDALHSGPIHDALLPGIQQHVAQVKAATDPDAFNSEPNWSASLEQDWLCVISRLLLRMQGYRHGGAILITPDSGLATLNVKYPLVYARLRTALLARARTLVLSTSYSSTIFSDYLGPRKSKTLPIILYLDEAIAEDELKDSQSELDGALWFVSLLSRVDGAVVLDPELGLLGFGTEIQVTEVPRAVYRANDPKASQRAELDYNHFGTRHRSMMRYCAAVPGSVGFVVSQDGDVRAVTQVGDQLVVWENIKLRLDDFERERRRYSVTTGKKDS